MAAPSVTLAKEAAPERPARRLPSPAPLRPLWSRMRPYAPALAVGTIALLASVGIGLIFPLLVYRLLDSAFVAQNASLLDKFALTLLGIFAVQGALNFAQVWLLTTVAERVVAKLRSDLFAHVIRLSPGFFTERRTGELTSRLSSDVALLQSVMSYQVTELTRQLLFLVGALGMLTWLHPRLTLTTLLVVPPVVGAALFFGRLLRRASTGVQDRVAEATGTAEEAFAQIRTVQGFVHEGGEVQRFDSHLQAVVRAAISRARIRGAFFGAITFFAFAGIVAVLWRGGRLVVGGALTPGALVSFLLYAFQAAAAVGALGSLFGSYQEAIGAAKRVFELLNTQPEIADPPAPRALPRPVRGEVRLDRVTFRYAPSHPDVLRDVSLHIAPGEVVALVGPSGAGKTTVASLLPRFWDPQQGRILLDGIDARQLALADLRGAIGIVPQEPTLFSGSVRENIAYGRPEASEREIVAAARAAHALEFIENLPDGLDTRVGERGVKLSGGQRQRLAIARVFLKNPAVVVLDEATSSLDSESERLVEEAMETLLQERSTLIIAHRLSTVRRADRVVVISRGEIVEEGSHDQLLSGDGVYARLYRVQYGDTGLEGRAES